MKTNLFLLLLCGLSWSASAQQRLSGRVSDAGGTPLAFVSIILNETPGRGTLTDIEGRFVIDAKEKIEHLSFRYVGYSTVQLKASDWATAPNDIRVTLREAVNELAEAVVTPRENYANVLIRRAIDKRIDNNPERRGNFVCKTYNKIAFDPIINKAAVAKLMRDSAKSKSKRETQEEMRQFEKNVAQQMMFLMESVTERSFRPPNQVQEKVLLNRVSGLKNSGIVALANAVQPFSCYGDYLKIVGKNFVNPISPGSVERYNFRIADTLYDGADTIWVIAFKPRKGKIFEALEGVLHLHQDNWAVQNFRAQPAFLTGIFTLKIEQSYQRVTAPDGDKVWFPNQLNFEIFFPKYPSPYYGIKAGGKSYLSDIQIDAPLRMYDFNPEQPMYIEAGAETRSDSAWQSWRGDAALDSREQRTYTFLDSITEQHNLDIFSTLMNMVSTGLLHLKGPLSLDLTQVLKFNDFEGTRLGIGLSTAQYLPLRKTKRIEMSAYGGYGLRDKTWKYGAFALWRIQRGSQTHLRVGARYDLLEPGALYELQPPALVNRTFYAQKMDYAREAIAILSSMPLPGLQLQATYRMQRLQPGYAYSYTNTEQQPINIFEFQEATAYLRYAANPATQTLFGNTQPTAFQRFPVLELAHTIGWGKHRYQRTVAALSQVASIRKLGKLIWRIEAGTIGADAPLAKLFTLNQTGQGRSGTSLFALSNTFQSLPDTLFLSNRFANVYLSQEIGPVLYRHKYSSPHLTLIQNCAWGALDKPEIHQEIGFRKLNQPLLESGIRLDDLVRLNYVNAANLGLGGAVFYRWGGLSEANWRKNFVPRLVLRLSL